MVKASDFKSLFPGVNQKHPAFRHSITQRNEPIKGAQASALKFSPSICTQCNNARTQPFDRAWERLSAYVRESNPLLKPKDPLPCTSIFGQEHQAAMANVHFYFTKLLGCYAVEYGVPLPINAFALAINTKIPYPNLRISFVSVLSNATKKKIYVSHINALQRGKSIVSANWFYVIGPFGVYVTYNEPGHPKLNKYNGWHPSDISPTVRMR